jgi:DNA topoisomerase I
LGVFVAKNSQPNGKSLVIVESPAKAKTINKYLGSDFVVKASMGHVRDLPERDLGIDIENDFRPTYHVVGSRKKTIDTLKKAAKDSPIVYLATDLDREGEAIAWHLAEALDLDPERTRRVVFNEITKTAIKEAFDHPHELDMGKVDAQQARRTLDRIVGYQLSPLLWQKIAKGLSAGRVQSVAVRLVVEREWEIRAFIPTESWRIQTILTPKSSDQVDLAKSWSDYLTAGAKDGNERTIKERLRWLGDHGCVSAELASVDGKAPEPKTHEEALRLAEAAGFVCERVEESVWDEYKQHGIKKVRLIGGFKSAESPDFVVSDIQKRRTTSKPPGPYATASLQQAASTQLSFSTSKTMRVAQSLYEGVDIGDADGSVGLITYMRTDSTNLSKDSVVAIRDLISSQFGGDYLPKTPNVYSSKKKHTQEAHEAIRPSDVSLSPESLKGRLTAEQWKLYDLIWRRTVACQMMPALWDSTTLSISTQTPIGEVVFKATGRQLVFDGFQRVSPSKSGDDLILPKVSKTDAMWPITLQPEQQFTSPPPRYSEASLVKSLEAEGIGRPSTYAAIIKTIQDRGYVEQLNRRFYATDKGVVVTEKLIEHFPDIMSVKFTSHMEDELDKIEEAQVDWVTVMREFYKPFKKALDKAGTEMTPARSEPSEYKCPDCEKEMVYRWGRTGRFLSCTGYPECKGAYNIDRAGHPIEPTKVETKCQECEKDMVLRQSRHGFFLGCSGYPECDNTVPCDETGVPLKIVPEEELETPCTSCGEGTMKVKRAGMRVFMGCDQYPKCKNTSKLPDGFAVERKQQPVEGAGFGCDKCGREMLIRTGRRGKFVACSGFPRCRNTKAIEKLDELKALAAEGKLPITVVPSKDDASGGANGSKKAARKPIPKTKAGKVDLEALGPPSPGFAWTRTGRPVVETWPEGTLSCPDCGSEMTMRSGRFGPFFSCSSFPKCKCSVNLRGAAKKRAEIEMPAPVKPKPIPTDIACEECGEKMLIRAGRSGKFLGCSNYPKCKATKPVPEGVEEALTAEAAGETKP